MNTQLVDHVDDASFINDDDDALDANAQDIIYLSVFVVDNILFVVDEPNE